jgi:hypothetical protein
MNFAFILEELYSNMINLMIQTGSLNDGLRLYSGESLSSLVDGGVLVQQVEDGLLRYSSMGVVLCFGGRRSKRCVCTPGAEPGY